jgi:hypothetical protein
MTDVRTQQNISTPWRRCRRGITFALLVYLAVWGITWLFGPKAVTREIAAYHSKTTAHGEVISVPFYANCEFSGTKWDYGPNPIPDTQYWCCIGRPVAPVPLVVTSEFSFVKGGLDAGAGQATFLWTPWHVYHLDTEWVWIT